MKITIPNNKLKTLRKGDPNFCIKLGKYIAPRAGFEISQRCPESYRSLIVECVQNGWIEPVAYMRESEYVWEKLAE